MYQPVLLHQIKRSCNIYKTLAARISTEVSRPHVPVLCAEAVTALKPQPGQLFIDMTFGYGGHTQALFDACPDIKIIALDRDPSTIKYADSLQATYGKEKFIFLNGKFTELLELLEENGEEVSSIADGILLDVGPSSMQFGDRSRGFGLSQRGPLDMRMNRKENIPTAAEVLNKLEERDLQLILKIYGQEKRAKQIARQIVEQRQALGPIETTRDLQDLVADTYRNLNIDSDKDKLGRARHPATLTFQALRIFVNDELNELYNGLKVAHQLLKPVAKCAVISFHSLEHSIVHQTFNYNSVKTRQTLVANDLEYNIHIWKSNCIAIKPTEEEINKNPRARSAELRVAAKKPAFF